MRKGAGEPERTDGHGHDSRDGEENEGSREEGVGNGVLAGEDTVLDEEVDNSSEASRDGGGDTEAGEDGGESLSSVPSPVDRISTTDSDSDSSDGRDDRVSGRNGPRHAGADGKPDGGGDEGADEGEELNSGVATEDVDGLKDEIGQLWLRLPEQ